MKNPKHELFGRMQRQYHREHPWRLSKEGLYIPHSYEEKQPDDLSWWDDVGFIVNGRRVVVWWQHPRDVYRAAIDEQSWLEAGPGPDDGWLFDGATKNYKRVGASRKKLVSYTSRSPSDAQKARFENLKRIRKRLTVEGIDLAIPARWMRERLDWATGITLVCPLEARSEAELIEVASLARRLLLGQTTLEREFPRYQYGKADWLKEQVSAS